MIHISPTIQHIAGHSSIHIINTGADEFVAWE